jgi:hypothetical protein
MKLKPFNITDLREQKEKDKRNKNCNFKEIENKKYFNINFKMPGVNGKERKIKIYLDDDIKKIIDNFSKIYYLKTEVKEKLTKIIIDLKNDYLEKNHIK